MIVNTWLVVAIITLLTIKIEARKSRLDGLRLCERRTGQNHVSIEDARWKNDDCAIECIMHYAFTIAFYVDDGTPCRKAGDRCLLGQCRSKNEFIKPVEKLWDTEIRVIKAYVRDKDHRSDSHGDSDAFIRVDVTKDGSPTYVNGDHVCLTNIVRDNNRPIWDYTCQPLPMSLSTLIKFSASDYENPFEKPDSLGYHEERLSYLMNTGIQRLTLIENHEDGLYSKHYIEVEVRGKPHKYNIDNCDD